MARTFSIKPQRNHVRCLRRITAAITEIQRQRQPAEIIRNFSPAIFPAVDQAKRMPATAAQTLATRQNQPKTPLPTMPSNVNPPTVHQPSKPQIQGQSAKSLPKQQCADFASKAATKQQSGDARGTVPLDQKALQLCPKLCPAMNNLASAFSSISHLDSAKKWIESTRRCDPANAQIKKTETAINAAAQQHLGPQQGTPTNQTKPPPPRRQTCRLFINLRNSHRSRPKPNRQNKCLNRISMEPIMAKYLPAIKLEFMTA